MSETRIPETTDELISSEFSKLSAMLQRCENERLQVEQRLVALVAAIREFASVADSALTERNTTVRELNRAVAVHREEESSRYCDTYGSGWNRGTCYPTNNDEQRLRVEPLPVELFDQLRNVNEDIQQHNSRIGLFGRVADRLHKLRTELISLDKLQRNSATYEFRSLLLALRPREKYRGCVPTLNNVFGFNGSAMDELRNARTLRSWKTPHIGQRSLSIRGKTNGVASIARGERLLKTYSHQRWGSSRNGQRFDELQANMLDSRYDRLRYAATQQLRNGNPRSILARAVAELDSLTVANNWEAALQKTYGKPNPVAVVRELRTVREYAATATDIEPLERWRACDRLRQRSTDNVPGVAVQFVVSTPQPFGIVTVELPERIATAIGCEPGTFQLPVIRWKTLQVGGSEYWEYATATVQPGTVPGFVRYALQYVSTLHESCNPEQRVEGSCATDKLKERIEREFSHRLYLYRNQRNKEKLALSLRKRNAQTLRQLRRIPAVTLQDSYDVGNCVPGTAEFCRSLGITTSSVTGRELAKFWKRSGYVQNSLFFAVVDNLQPLAELTTTTATVAGEN